MTQQIKLMGVQSAPKVHGQLERHKLNAQKSTAIAALLRLQYRQAQDTIKMGVKPVPKDSNP